MVPEAPLERSETGLGPAGPGWFVVNARDAHWYDSERAGARARFEQPGAWFPQIGVVLNLLAPGQAMAQYHSEDAQEDFLVLAGECVLVVEGQERRLAAWDFVHCPAGTAHVIVGAGQEPALVLAVGARPPKGERERFVYPVDEVAARHGASVARETTNPGEAYAGFPGWRSITCPPGFPAP